MRKWRALTDGEIVELATRLRSSDWSWRMDEVPALASAFGWQVQLTQATGVLLDAGFGLGSGRVHGDDGVAQSIELMVTTFATDDAAGRANIRDAFARMTTALSGALGEPTARTPGKSAEIRWTGTQTTLLLKSLTDSLELWAVTNTWLALHDKTVELQDRYVVSTEQRLS